MGIYYGIYTLLSICVYVLLRKCLFVARIYGESMMPTLQDGNYVIGIRVPQTYGFRRMRTALLHKGAIVLVRPPAHLSRLEVKRVSGLYENLNAFKWVDLTTDQQAEIEDYIVLDGDGIAKSQISSPNIGTTSSSRAYLYCPASMVVSYVLFRFWPLEYLGYPLVPTNSSSHAET